MSPKLFPRLQATAIDGRQHNPLHRHVQLERLHAALLSHAPSIKSAIAADYSYSPAEVAIEFSATLRTLKHYYSLLKPEQFHQKEYHIANRRDNPSNRSPAGIVYIEPDTMHSLFYSAVTAVGAALAAGSCVVLLLENKLESPAVSNLLRTSLTEALDADVFAITPERVTDEKFLHGSISVFQSERNDDGVPRMNQLVSATKRPAVAVVDRTADVELAALDLVAARIAFGGRSPYAPDIVLVNEFTKDAFLQAATKQYARLSEETKSIPETSNRISTAVTKLQRADPGCQVLQQKPGLTIVHLASRNTLLQQKIGAPVLVIHTITSLDNAIDLVNSKTTNPCLAAYHFGNPAVGKYLSQFIPAEVSFVNHIPRELLIGPAAPVGRKVNVANRYDLDMLTVPRPVYINPSKESQALGRALNSRTSDKLISDWAATLREFKRHPGGGIGFFEKGFLINAGLILASALTISATGVVWWWNGARPVF